MLVSVLTILYHWPCGRIPRCGSSTTSCAVFAGYSSSTSRTAWLSVQRPLANSIV